MLGWKKSMLLRLAINYEDRVTTVVFYSITQLLHRRCKLSLMIVIKMPKSQISGYTSVEGQD